MGLKLKLNQQTSIINFERDSKDSEITNKLSQLVEKLSKVSIINIPTIFTQDAALREFWSSTDEEHTKILFSKIIIEERKKNKDYEEKEKLKLSEEARKLNLSDHKHEHSKVVETSNIDSYTHEHSKPIAVQEKTKNYVSTIREQKPMSKADKIVKKIDYLERLKREVEEPLRARLSTGKFLEENNNNKKVQQTFLDTHYNAWKVNLKNKQRYNKFLDDSSTFSRNLINRKEEVIKKEKSTHTIMNQMTKEYWDLKRLCT